MILEGIVTTANDDGSINVAPMGPFFPPGAKTLELRPFEGSRTYDNLCRTGQGVLHVVDNVMLFANAVTRDWPTPPETGSAQVVDGAVLGDCCRWYEFRVTSRTGTPPRWSMHCEIVHSGRKRDFYGFNRGKHAVIEAAIMATRLDFLPGPQIIAELERLRPWVVKTGGPNEQAAFEKLERFICDNVDGDNRIAHSVTKPNPSNRRFPEGSHRSAAASLKRDEVPGQGDE